MFFNNCRFVRIYRRPAVLAANTVAAAAINALKLRFREVDDWQTRKHIMPQMMVYRPATADMVSSAR